jgi:hypothetical protein
LLRSYSYLPSYPLICLAAQYSLSVYERPTGKERETHVDADWRMGTKAMIMKSVPVDNMNVIVFAIRGSVTFVDWAVNLDSEPTAPTGFLVSISFFLILELDPAINLKSHDFLSNLNRPIQVTSVIRVSYQ